MNESKEKVYQNYLNELKRGIRSDELEAFEEKRVLDELTEELEELKSRHAGQKKKYEDLQKSLQLQYKDFFNTYSAGIGAWKPDLIQNAEIVELSNSKKPDQAACGPDRKTLSTGEKDNDLDEEDMELSNAEINEYGMPPANPAGTVVPPKPAVSKRPGGIAAVKRAVRKPKATEKKETGKRYRHPKYGEIFVSEWGEKFCTVYKIHTEFRTELRLESRELPVVETREQAQINLNVFAAKYKLEEVK